MQHNHTPDQDQNRKQPAVEQIPSKSLFSAAVALIIPALTGAAYLTGVSYHRAYLQTFNVPYGVINKSTADYFLAAHKAIVTTFVEAIMSASAPLILSWIFVVLVLWFGIDSLGKWLDRHPRMTRFRARAKRSARFRLFGNVFGIPALLSLFFAYVVFGTALILIVPVAIGESGGKLDAVFVRSAISLGCDRKNKINLPCTDVKQGGKLLGRGFILDASDKHVFLVEEGVAKILPIGDHSFETHAFPAVEKPIK